MEKHTIWSRDGKQMSSCICTYILPLKVHDACINTAEDVCMKGYHNEHIQKLTYKTKMCYVSSHFTGIIKKFQTSNICSINLSE